MTNIMDEVRLEKVTLNLSFAGRPERQNAAVTVAESLAGQKPVLSRAKKTVREFGIHKGEPMAAVVTLRKEKAEDFLNKALVAVNRRMKASSFDGRSTLNFGVSEHITIPGMKYVPELGIFGFNVAITLSKPGKRVEVRRESPRRLPAKKFVNRDEALEFMRRKFSVEFDRGD